MKTTIALESKSLQERFLERGITPMSDAEAQKMANPSLCDPNCPECHGAGYIREYPDAKIHEKKFGKIKMCSHYSIRLLKERIENGLFDSRTGIEPTEIDLTWELIKPKMSDGIKAVQAIKPKFEDGHGMVLLIGAFGQGKTLVGKILVASALRSGRSASYANMSRILDDIRLAFDSQEMKSTELLRRMEWWNSLDILFIDELDKMNRTDWAQERMFELLDRRYTRAIREEALTVVATNSPIGELDGYLRSRLMDNRLGPIVELTGPDGRLSVPKSNKF